MSRCWAYSPDGSARCELEAGHEEDHTTFRVWKDDQCWMPTSPAKQVIITPTQEPAAPLPPPPPPADRCVACQHKHRGRECPGACECKEFIG